jgi:hypothetical protein
VLRPTLFRSAIFALLITAGGNVSAGTLAHYAPSVYNIRDFLIPDPGFYMVFYAPYYHTDKYKDDHGNPITSITGPNRTGQIVTLAYTTDIDVETISPEFIWVPHWTLPGGGKIGAYVAPSFGNSSVSASLETATGRDVSSSHSQFATGDLFVQPVWLGWATTHWDLSAAYGAYAPTGKYNTEVTTLRLSGLRFRGIAPDNVGLGFWEHQFQGAIAWYPWEDKRSALSIATTYELSEHQQGTGLTPGSELTLNWGWSQYVPLRRDKSLLLEIGPAGYCQWQTSYDYGPGVDPTNNPLSSVIAAGFQTGLTYVPWKAFINFRFSSEFDAIARFQGNMSSISIGKKIF